jgi:2-polyprenyl-3-methyl-5-hydroxy-6-metoxy-1,4-benzoquinol methylase
MARIYSESRVVFNRSVKDDLNMRVFEALASGSLLLTNVLPDSGQSDFFRDGVHLATYQGSEELLDKLRFYLRNEDERERIAEAGRLAALAEHTYRRRMQTLLATVASGLTGDSSREQADDGLPEQGGGQPAHGPLSAAVDRHELSYFEFARPELLALIPKSARRVLEIGCGTGRLGEALKRRQPCEVVGVELDERAAALAETRLDRVICGNVERMEFDFSDGEFDAIVCGDVLEHLYDANAFLARCRRWLKPEGLLAASIPNVRHHSVVASLLEGNWSYEPAGLLDETHLRFFSRGRIERVFQRSGYRILEITPIPGPGHDEWRQQGSPGEVRLGAAMLKDLSREEAEEFFVYQYLVTAAPRDSAEVDTEQGVNGLHHDAVAHADHSQGVSETVPLPPAIRELPAPLPKCLLLMVTYNRLEYTRLALDSVLELDYPNLEVVIWDNASTDGTVGYLQERLAGVERVRLVASEENRGVVHPMNAVWGSDAQAQLLAKIDNDTLVPPDLLRRLANGHLQSHRFGALSGFHFREHGAAQADESRIKSFDGVRVLPQPYVGGCAVMLRRQTFETLGPIPCSGQAQIGPFMDSGWTLYQQQLTSHGLINGYPWPLINVDHREDTRSRHCIRSAEHQDYKQALRGMDLEEFTQELCVWRPHWADEKTPAEGDSRSLASASAAAAVAEPAANGSFSNRPAPPVNRMRFNQDFRRDFEQVDFRGAPFALARFGDGERAICRGAPVQSQDGWRYAGGRSQLAADLNASLRYNAPGYYIGISDGCCDLPARDWYLQRVTVPLEQLTFANLFVNSNYRRFCQLDLSGMAVVAASGGDYEVPEDLVRSSFDIDELVERLLAEDRPILVSAGPAACVIIHKYWQRAQRKQVIVDVGSAIDERIKRRKTRQYQVPGTRTAQLTCTW